MSDYEYLLNIRRLAEAWLAHRPTPHCDSCQCAACLAARRTLSSGILEITTTRALPLDEIGRKKGKKK